MPRTVGQSGIIKTCELVLTSILHARAPTRLGLCSELTTVDDTKFVLGAIRMALVSFNFFVEIGCLD